MSPTDSPRLGGAASPPAASRADAASAPKLDLPTPRATAMTATSWQNAESTSFPLSAPELHRARHETSGAMAVGGSAHDSLNSSPRGRLHQLRKGFQVASAVAHVTEMSKHTSTSAVDEKALREGRLSGPRVCQALLQGDMSPASFALSVSAMNPDKLRQWLESFGKCVSMLGRTIASLQHQIKQQLRRKDKQRMREVVYKVQLQCSALRIALGHLRQGVTEALGEAQKQLTVVWTSWGVEVIRSRRVRDRWNRALVVAIAQARRDKQRLLRVIESLGNGPSDSLQFVADTICEACHDIGRCGQAHVLLQDNRPSLFEVENPKFHRLFTRTSNPEEYSAARVTMLDCLATPVAIDSIAGDMASRTPRDGRPLLECFYESAHLERRFVAIEFGHRCEATPKLYCRDADSVPPISPPNQLLYLSLTHGPQISALRLADMRKGIVMTKELEHRLKQLAPIFSLGLRTAFEVSYAHRNQGLIDFVRVIVPCLAPVVRPQTILRKMRAEKVMIWAAQLKELLSADRCSVFLYNPLTETLSTYADDVGDDEVRIPVKTRPDAFGGLAAQCAREAKLINRHLSKSVRQTQRASGYKVHGALIAPIFSSSSGAMLGVCELLNKKGNLGPTFSSDDELLLRATLRVAALEIENHVLMIDYVNLCNGKPRGWLFGAD